MGSGAVNRFTGRFTGASADISVIRVPFPPTQVHFWVEDPVTLELNTTLDGAAEVAVVSTTNIPANTPQTGRLRITLDSGVVREVPYLSWATATFTISSTNFEDPNDATAGNAIGAGYLVEGHKTNEMSGDDYVSTIGADDGVTLTDVGFDVASGADINVVGASVYYECVD